MDDKSTNDAAPIAGQPEAQKPPEPAATEPAAKPQEEQPGDQMPFLAHPMVPGLMQAGLNQFMEAVLRLMKEKKLPPAIIDYVSVVMCVDGHAVQSVRRRSDMPEAAVAQSFIRLGMNALEREKRRRAKDIVIPGAGPGNIAAPGGLVLPGGGLLPSK